MRAVLSRVTAASVTVDGSVTGSIGVGLLALIGVTHTDDADRADRLAGKIAGLRMLHDELSVIEAGAAVLVVSQFTLYGDTRKGRRPSWSAAAPRAVAEPLIDRVVTELRKLQVPVETGVFGARMAVTSVNDGPFTLVIEV